MSRQRKAKQSKSSSRKLTTAIVIAAISFSIGGLAWCYLSSKRDQPQTTTMEAPLPSPVVVVDEKDFTDDGFSSSVQGVMKVIRSHSKDPYLGPFVKQTLESTPEIEALIEPLFEVQEEGQTIDIILQNHGGNINSPEDARRTKYSQRLIYRLLQEGKYDVVAIEGSDLSPVTLQGLREQALKVFPPEEVEPRLAEMMERISSVRYAVDHPSAIVIGYEHDTLNLLGAEVGVEYETSEELGQTRTQLSTKELWSFLNTLHYLDNEVAVARIIRELKQRGRKRGAIVIGYNHANHLIWMLKKLRIRSAVYDTYTPAKSGV
jgi:VIT1/CCC1 family predicted Fe2+/Mn2+ transporter